MRLLFNILAVTGSAMFGGVMLTIGVTLGGYWKSLPAAEFLHWFSQNNGFISAAIPLVVVPTLLGLIGSLWLGWGAAETRMLWIGSAACIAGVLALTMNWFVPTNAQFAAKALPLDQVPDRLNTWIMIHYVRIGLAAAASVLGLLATSR
ncbi:MAG: DUF1772 domain-containing protein [Mesorhizobium sp.]|uniref:DUF1772 domain-containing protein n=1 Tax=Mesorhizobium sp. TaxID=1871066 RepID=UPI0012078BBE|nr:DUF1772 domain-containing protein [Mesorhizobium sp.]TIL97327.1 MAG: DUF1772 domain-containing protein [Mesorhizobium sp.]